MLACRKWKTSFFEDKEACQENNGIALQENQNLERNKVAKKVSKDSHVTGTQ